jgi:hypothetical protein
MGGRKKKKLFFFLPPIIHIHEPDAFFYRICVWNDLHTQWMSRHCLGGCLSGGRRGRRRGGQSKILFSLHGAHDMMPCGRVGKLQAHRDFTGSNPFAFIVGHDCVNHIPFCYVLFPFFYVLFLILFIFHVFLFIFHVFLFKG